MPESLPWTKKIEGEVGGQTDGRGVRKGVVVQMIDDTSTDDRAGRRA